MFVFCLIISTLLVSLQHQQTTTPQSKRFSLSLANESDN